MATKLHLQDKAERLLRRRRKIQQTVRGTSERPRLVVFNRTTGAMRAIIKWANANQGVLALLALLVMVPTLLILAYNGYRRLFPAKSDRETRIKDDEEGNRVEG